MNVGAMVCSFLANGGWRTKMGARAALLLHV
jgi:hypothetical protein